MIRIALIALVIISASCTKNRTCTCRVNDTNLITRQETYTRVTKKRADERCEDLGKMMVPPYTVASHTCKVE